MQTAPCGPQWEEERAARLGLQAPHAVAWWNYSSLCHAQKPWWQHLQRALRFAWNSKGWSCFSAGTGGVVLG